MFLTALTACAGTGQQYKGEAGLRKYFPEATCGKTVKTSRVIRTERYEPVDMNLFEEFGYCVPESRFTSIAIRAGMYHNGFSIPYSGRIYAPGTAVNPQVWIRALEDADTDANGVITKAEADTLVERTLREIEDRI